MTPHREALQALERLKSGASTLDSAQYLELLEAVEEAVHALVLAPNGSDPVATGLWYNHERSPALARLTDALAGRGPDAAPAAQPAAQTLAEQRAGDAEVLRQLHQALLERGAGAARSSRRPG